jgi:hypothetical protein
MNLSIISQPSLDSIEEGFIQKRPMLSRIA